MCGHDLFTTAMVRTSSLMTVRSSSPLLDSDEELFGHIESDHVPKSRKRRRNEPIATSHGSNTGTLRALLGLTAADDYIEITGATSRPHRDQETNQRPFDNLNPAAGLKQVVPSRVFSNLGGR